MSLADELLAGLREHHPLAADLALRVCLPVRVTPAFVRLARLRLLPQAGTGDEADLWLSGLVESRSGSGFSLRRDVRQTLRSLLAADAALLDQVWTQVHAAHAPWLAPRARMEEELTWRLLAHPADAAVDALWAGVVHDLDRSPNAEGVARWVTRAMPDLPPGSLLHEHGRLAFHGAHLLLGDASVFGDQPQAFTDSATFAFATRRLPRQALHIGACEDRVLASASQPIQQGHTLQIPATRPLWLQVETRGAKDGPTGEATARRVLLIDPAAPVAELSVDGPFLPGSGPLRLRSLDGAAWDLVTASSAASPAAAPRTSRVELGYEAEVYGSRKRVQLPFVVGVLADLGQNRESGATRLEDRRFVNIEADKLDEHLQALRPGLAFRVPHPFDRAGQLAVNLSFARLADFQPDAVARQIDRHGHWQRVVRGLESLSDRLESGELGVEPLLQLLANGAELARLQQQPEGGDAGLWALAEAAAQFGAEALAFPDLLRGLENVREQIRQGLNALLDAVHHHPDFQRLEGTWRGLHQLVMRTPTDEMTKVRVFHITRKELVQSLARSQGPDWDQGVLFKKIHAEEFGQFGGEPYGLLLVDQAFDHQPADVATLQALARIGAASHAPVLAAASPSLFQLERWRDLSSVRDLARLFVTPDYAAWRHLREQDESRYLGLTLPPVLARPPWTSDRSGDVPFDESTPILADDGFTWMSSAWLLAANVAQAFARDHWFARIAGLQSGGLVGDMATFAFGDGSVAELSPTGVAITDRLEAGLSQLGLTALVPRRHSDSACFYSVPTLHQPPAYEDREAQQMALAGARLAPVLACSRLMLTLACMLRDQLGQHSPQDIEYELRTWVQPYIGGSPGAGEDDGDADTPDKPFESVQIDVVRAEDEAGPSRLVVVAVPRYQFQGLRAPLRLTLRLPAAGFA